MNTPKNLKYTRTHEWEALDGKTARVGISDFAQNRLGKLVFVNLPAAGDALTAGEPFCDVESVKSVADINAPFDGTVTAVNEELPDDPGQINDDPYGAWLIEAEMDSDLSGLMDADAYDAFCATEE